MLMDYTLRALSLPGIVFLITDLSVEMENRGKQMSFILFITWRGRMCPVPRQGTLRCAPISKDASVQGGCGLVDSLVRKHS